MGVAGAEGGSSTSSSEIVYRLSVGSTLAIVHLACDRVDRLFLVVVGHARLRGDLAVGRVDVERVGVGAVQAVGQVVAVGASVALAVKKETATSPGRAFSLMVAKIGPPPPWGNSGGLLIASARVTVTA